MDTVALLKILSDAFGPSGFEIEVRETLEQMVRPLVDEVRTDALGNLIAIRHGTSPRTLMLDAHMDEVGFMISHIDHKGFLRLAPLGGWDVRILLAQAVTIQTREGKKVRGIVGTVPPHMLNEKERRKQLEITDLFIDIGATSNDEVHEWGVNVGDPAVIHYPFEQVNDSTLTGKAFDDRAGCAVAVQTLQRLQDVQLPWTLAAAFVVREETGLRGARTAANQLQPEVALALEGTIAADLPGVKAHKCPTSTGKGPAISVADNSFIVPREMVQFLESLADDNDMPYQYKTPLYGGTDAGAIHDSGKGVKCGVVSVPCRYIHAPLAMLRLSDLEHTVTLVDAFVRRAPEQFA